VQNYFVAEDFPLEVPVAREIVPNISRLATAMRNVGGLVAWVQTTATGGLERCTVRVLWIVPVLRF
jgi:ureidoacrylate peracid hydrolase